MIAAVDIKRIEDDAGFAMDTVGKVDLNAFPPGCILNELVDLSGTEAGAGSGAVPGDARINADRWIYHVNVRWLIFSMERA